MTKKPPKYSTIAFAGDFCLSGDEIKKCLNNNRTDPWAPIRSVFGDDTAIIANLECPFTNENEGIPYKWANLKASPDLHWTLDGLAMAVLGNNHMADFGIQGTKETQRLLTSKSIEYLGFGASLRDSLKPAFLNVNGQKLGVVSLCCPTTNSENIATHRAAGVAPLGMNTLKQAIERTKSECDALAVYLHWGCEFVHDPAPDQLRLARYAIDCGADAVVGCHSHTIQSFENYRGRWIFYGLGNYLFKAGFAQALRSNGEIEQIPLELKPSNRESLVVSFNIVPESGSGRLRLEKVQPMLFDDTWVPRPSDVASLTFDLEAANSRLHAYTTRHEQALLDRREPVFLSKLLNGIFSYWYSAETINPPTRHILRGLTNRIINRLLSIPRVKMSNCANNVKNELRSYNLALRIRCKWIKDRRYLPLTPAHLGLYNIIHRLCWYELKDFPNLIDCRDFNDRIQWLKLFDQSSEIVRCSDKILVRDYVRERVGDRYLVKLYQVHDHFSQINFDVLPNSFVIKANHDSGTVILVREKAMLNRVEAENMIENALQKPFGWANGEWAYSYIKPRVLVEEFIEPENHTPPPDYKFYCVEGSVKFVHFISDRGHGTKEQTLDRQGNDLETELYPSFRLSKEFIKPQNWTEMIRVAEQLGNGFKCVRVDLFCSGGNIYAGEMTFWPMMGCYKGEGQKKLGKLLDFDRTTFKPLFRFGFEKM
jgi:hypothetical protein